VDTVRNRSVSVILDGTEPCVTSYHVTHDVTISKGSVRTEPVSVVKVGMGSTVL